MIEFKVEDMTCGHCVETISRALKALDPSGQVEVDLASKRVRVDSPLAAARLAAAIEDAGYAPVLVSGG